MYRIKADESLKKDLIQCEKLLHCKKNENIISGENNTEVDFICNFELEADYITRREWEKIKHEERYHKNIMEKDEITTNNNNKNNPK